jgi:hypothetical protein
MSFAKESVSSPHFENSPRFEAIPSSRGKAFVIRNALAYGRNSAWGKGVLVDHERTLESSPNGAGLRITWEELGRGYNSAKEASPDEGFILTVRTGEVRVKIESAEGRIEEHILGKDGAVFIGKGTRYEWEALSPAEIITATAPNTFHADTSNTTDAVFVEDVWTAGPNNKSYFAGHFFKKGDQYAQCLDLEGKGQHTRPEVPDSMGRPEDKKSTSQYGCSIVMLLEGEYTLFFEVEPGRKVPVTLKPGDAVYWDNRVTHFAEGKEGAKQMFFRTPSLQPNTTLVA